MKYLLAATILLLLANKPRAQTPAVVIRDSATARAYHPYSPFGNTDSKPFSGREMDPYLEDKVINVKRNYSQQMADIRTDSSQTARTKRVKIRALKCREKREIKTLKKQYQE